MGKSRIKTKTTYFLVTTNGNLRRISPSLVGLAACFLIFALAFLSGQCFIYNRGLVAERAKIKTELAQINSQHQQMKSELGICEENQQKISQLLNFNTDSGKTGDEK
ncbi:MAG: hypothetical protein V1794_08530 [Candidatus Glassbacteria bacterium]